VLDTLSGCSERTLVDRRLGPQSPIRTGPGEQERRNPMTAPKELGGPHAQRTFDAWLSAQLGLVPYAITFGLPPANGTVSITLRRPLQ